MARTVSPSAISSLIEAAGFAGTGVTFYITGGADINWNGAAQVKFAELDDHTIVTSAASSPRESASPSAAKTS